ncbi:MAG: hypothetical protein NTX24_04840 [Candidatus Pacearchaeota archaeon]|nr:hypothetical protein [Candidatus Pacearchaeota archaeon]
MRKEDKQVEKKKSWIERHRTLSIILGVLLIFIAIGWFINNNFPSEQTQTNSGQPLNNDISQQTASESWHNVTSFDGKGNENTESFMIKGSKVRITARTWGSPGVGSVSGIRLEKDTGGYIGTGLSISTQGYDEGNSETIYRNLKSGNYYIGVISGIEWEVRVEEYY